MSLTPGWRGLLAAIVISVLAYFSFLYLPVAAQLRRPINVRQGRGSVLEARPLEDGRAEVGGRVELVERRPFTLAAS